jgi:lipopolysaccharide export LptBFGC system permease protein LptF
MRITSLYLIRNVLIGFVAAAALLLPLFTTFDLISELDDVSSGGYRWTQALQVVLMTLPRRAVDLGPFIALLGGIVGLGQLALTQELTAMRTAGISIVRIAITTVMAGLILVLLLGVMDEWVASPLQQRGVQIRNEALAVSGEAASPSGSIWARRGDEVARIGAMTRHNTPVSVEIFRYTTELRLKSYVFADSAQIRPDGTWLLKNAQIKEWNGDEESIRQQDAGVEIGVFRPPSERTHAAHRQLLHPATAPLHPVSQRFGSAIRRVRNGHVAKARATDPDPGDDSVRGAVHLRPATLARAGRPAGGGCGGRAADLCEQPDHRQPRAAAGRQRAADHAVAVAGAAGDCADADLPF